MHMQGEIINRPYQQITLFFLCVLLVITANAGPVEIPDSARPGAVRPEQEESSVVPEEQPEVVVEPGPQVDSLDIPAVIDRPFDVDEGERIIVKEFRLLDGEDLPEYDVSLEELQEKLEGIRAKRPDGFTIGQLQEAANEIRAYYRERGLILTQVVVPVQTVQEGIVDFQVFVGRLGRVLVEGNKLYSSDILANAFDDLIGKPINKADIEAALLRLTDYPGLTIFGVFQPGQLVGTADIVLKTQEEKRFDVAFRIDNHGTQETGRNRFRTVIDWNNPTGADKVTLSVQQAYNPKNNVFLSFDYERFLNDGYKMLFTANRNKFDIGGDFAANQVHAESEQQGLTWEKNFTRSRVRNFTTYASFFRKKSVTTTANQPTNEDRLSVFSLGVDYDSVDSFSLNPAEGGGGINFANLEISHGLNNFFDSMGSHSDAVPRQAFGKAPSRQSGVDQRFASGQFTKVFGSYTRLQTIQKNVNLLFRSEFQWSDDLLVPLEQYSVGGADNVRAFPVAQVLWDRAYFLSFEFLINAPGIADKPALAMFGNRTWGELLQLAIFYDIAIGRVNEPVTGTDKKDFDNLKGAGAGLRFNLPGTFESRIFLASEIGGDDVGNDRNVQFWGDVTYSF